MKGQRPLTPEEFTPRFWARVNKSGGCWLWTGSKIKKGYGNVRFRRKVWRTHRVAWTLTHGEVPEGLCVLHSCDTRLCVNPAHLFLGTNSDNVQDRERKGRNIVLVGEKHGSSKLTNDKVRYIRSAAPYKTKKAIAAELGVYKSTVFKVLAGDTWRSVA